jgi:plastocyanin
VIAHRIVAALAFAAAAAAGAADRTIVVEGTAFSPARLTVQRGDRVTWVNKDPFPHTATAKGTFDSGPVAADASWSWVADKAGSFDYVCTLHPTMKARLVVR